MATQFTSKKVVSDWLKAELYMGPDLFSRETVTLLAGEEGVNGTPVGKITATEKYAIWDPDAVDGSQTAAGILYSDVIDPDTAVDRDVVIINNMASIIEEGLTWPTGTTDNEKTAVFASLWGYGIRKREGA